MSSVSSRAEPSGSGQVPSSRFDSDILTAAKGGTIVFAGDLFQYGGRFVLGLLMARLLGAEQLGLTNLALSGATIASIFALLGLQRAMVRYVSLFSNRRDTAGVWGTLQIGLGLTAILSLLIGIILYLASDTVAQQLFREPELGPLLRVASLVVPFMALSEILASALQGFKRMDCAVIGQKVILPLIRLVLTIGLAIFVGLNAKKALVVFNLAVIVVFFVLMYYLNVLFSLQRSLGTARRDIKEMLRFALPVYLSSLIRTFRGQLQTLLLGMLSTATSVGIFVVATRVNIIGRLFHVGINTASAPIVSELYDRGEWGEMARFYQAVTKWTFALNLPLFLVVLLYPGPILSIFGKSFVGGATALTILAWANLVDTGTGICGAVLEMTGNTKLQLFNSATTFVLSLGLNILLVSRWGIIGAAVAALAVVTVLNLVCVLEIFILYRWLPFNLGFVKPIAACLVAFISSWGVRLLAPFEMVVIDVIVNVIVILAVYAALILLMGLSREDRIVLSHVIRRAKAALPR